jgi:hypothetical protein
MGIATQDIAHNGWGYVTSFGLVRSLNTNAWTAGTILYYDPTVAGGLTNTIPAAPNAKVQVCAVVYQSASNGSLFVRPSFGGILGQYEGDVGLTSVAGGDVLVRNSGNTVWENKAQSTLIAGNVSGVVAITNGGTGSTNAADALTALGAYPASNPAGYTSNTGTVTSVDASAGTGISVTGGPITTSGTLTITNTAPDQVVSITAGSGISISGTYPNFTVTNTSSISLPVAIADGGTGATTISGAQTNLQVDPAGTAVAMAIALG